MFGGDAVELPASRGFQPTRQRALHLHGLAPFARAFGRRSQDLWRSSDRLWRLHDLIGTADDRIETLEICRLPLELAGDGIRLRGVAVDPNAWRIVEIDVEMGAIPRLAKEQAVQIGIDLALVTCRIGAGHVDAVTTCRRWHGAGGPPYSPDLNPIEQVFTKIKHLMRRAMERPTFIAERLNQDYLLGAGFSVADAYLFVMLMWARKNGLSLPVPLPAYFERMKARPAVQRSLKEEGLL
jgi:Glutathione S-transferase, C-terminal domain